MKKYFIPFETNQERDRIRKWCGITSGASLAVKTSQCINDDDVWNMIWTEGYVIDVKNPKTEMLMKLQFAQARRYFDQGSSALDKLHDVYLPSRR